MNLTLLLAMTIAATMTPAAAVTKAGGDAAAIDADLQATLKKYDAGL